MALSISKTRENVVVPDAVWYRAMLWGDGRHITRSSGSTVPLMLRAGTGLISFRV